MSSVIVALLLGTIAISLVIAVPASIYARRRIELRVRILEVLAATVRRGLPLGQALAAASYEFEGGRQWTVRRVLAGLADGYPLGRALARGAGRYFPHHVIAAIRAAEGDGDLAGTLEAAARTGLEGLALRHRVTLALLYPIGLLGGVSILSALMDRAYGWVAYVHRSPPLGALWMAEMAGRVSLVGVAFFVAIWAVGRLSVLARVAVLEGVPPKIVLLPSAPLARLVDRVLLAIPVLRTFALLASAERLLHALAPLVRGGVPLERALRRCAPASGNAGVASSAEVAARAIEEGGDPAAAIGAIRLPAFAAARAAAAAGGGRDRFAAGLAAIAAECRERFRARGEALASMIYPVGIALAAVLIAAELRVHLAVVDMIYKEIRPW